MNMEKNNFMRGLILTLTLLVFLNLTFSKVEVFFESSFFKLNVGENIINFRITNLEGRERNLILDVFPSIYNEVSCSLNQYFLTLKPFEKIELKIVCKVPISVKEFEYPIKLSVKEGENLIAERYLVFRIERKFEIAIIGYRIDKEEVEPNEPNYFEVKIKNFGSTISKEYSAIFEIKKDNVTYKHKEFFIPRLLENQEYTIIYNFNFSFFDEPSVYEVFCKIFDKNKNLIYEIYLPVKLKEIKTFEVDRKSQQGFYVSTVWIKVKNTGNVEQEIEVREKVPTIIVNLLKFQEKPLIVERGIDSELIWYIKLLPQEEKTIVYEFVFWPVVVLSIIIGTTIIFLLATYYTPLIVKKVTAEEEIFKVKLVAKNTSTKVIRNVIINDFLPNIYEIIEFETKKPEIKRTKNGYQLIWNIDKIEPKGEVIISYKVKPLIKILGKPKFPKPKMIYTIKDKNKKETKEARSK